jgi:hypothetical protein
MAPGLVFTEVVIVGFLHSGSERPVFGRGTFCPARITANRVPPRPWR